MYAFKYLSFRAVLLALILGLGAGVALADSSTGPSSSQSPYVGRLYGEGKSILTVGDAVNARPDGTPYGMVGIPDGLGAFDNGDGAFTLLMNHELGDTVVLRALTAQPAQGIT